MNNYNNNQGHIWIWGLVLALALILISSGGRLLDANPALEEHFAAQPTPPGFELPQLDLGGLPPEVQQAAQRLQRQLGMGQSVPALTPVAQGARLRTEISAVRRTADGVQVSGSVTNIGTSEVQVPVSAFELYDDTGMAYIADGGGAVRLAPGASTPLDLTAPLPEGRGLLLRLALPPDPPVEQVLLLAE